MSKDIEFETKVDEVKGKETIENEIEYRIVLKTMDKRAKRMLDLIGTWVGIKCNLIRKP